MVDITSDPADPTLANPVVGFLQPRQACKLSKDKQTWKCGNFLHGSTDALVNVLGTVACQVNDSMEQNKAEMILAANQANGFSDQSNSFVTTVINSGGQNQTDYLEAARKAGGAKRNLDNSESLSDCISLANNQNFIEGLTSSIQSGNYTQFPKNISATELKDELLGTCILNQSLATTCHYAMGSLDSDDDHGDDHGDDHSNNTYNCNKGKCEVAKKGKGMYTSMDSCKQNCGASQASKKYSCKTGGVGPSLGFGKASAGLGTKTCVQDDNGIYKSIEQCKKSCPTKK